MEKDEEQKKFLEQQLQWSKNQAFILEVIEAKLFEIKKLQSMR